MGTSTKNHQLTNVVRSLLTSQIFNNNKYIRGFASSQFNKALYKEVVKDGERSQVPQAVTEYRYRMYRSLFNSFYRNFDAGLISRNCFKKIFSSLVEDAMFQEGDAHKAVESFREKYGKVPPGFFVLSPTKACNLNCTGCYASSFASSKQKLDWETVIQLMDETHDEMGMRFYVISGGEPFMYKSEGKTILDLAERYPDSYFLVYTNGTLIDEHTARRLGEIGNMTPAISIEGFEEETDERRGQGVFKKIQQAAENLKQEGVPFGLSVTATKKNINVLYTDQFYDYFFNELGATYMWMFQYMPIGKDFTTDLMITPEQRFELFKQQERMIRQKEYFLADFWNSGIASYGCVAFASNRRGYFYVNWDGNIMPCVFIPYYKHNIKDLYSNNRKLADALFSDFFVKGREWQDNYLNLGGEMGNMLRPCCIRDHHKHFTELAYECNVKAEDKNAEEALKSEEYHAKMNEFDENLKNIVDPYWKKHYINHS